MVTLADIAKKVGVSHGAAGAVLGKNSATTTIRVGEKTRQKILKVAQDLGYRPHRQAQLLRGAKSGIIGVIKPISVLQEAVQRAFYLSQAIQKAGYGLLVTEILWDQNGLTQAIDSMLDARVEGVIFHGWSKGADEDYAVIKKLKEYSIPIVSSGNFLDVSVPTVNSNYRQGMYDLTKHLWSLGRRDIQMVLPFSESQLKQSPLHSIALRHRGFCDALKALGGKMIPSTFFMEEVPQWSDEFIVGQTVIRQLIKNRKMPEALVFSNDTTAVGALWTCVKEGIKVPEDVAITGFDNTTMGQYTHPTLTSVAQPTQELADKSVECLLDAIKTGKTRNNLQIELPCQLVVRQSCGAKTSQE